jgi:signal recognition particle receptor subunit beta
LIFIVDSNDVSRIEETRDELHNFLKEDEIRNANVLVYANKQDLPNAVKPKEMANLFQLMHMTNRVWHVQGTVATTGDGLYKGLEWIGRQPRK